MCLVGRVVTEQQCILWGWVGTEQYCVLWGRVGTEQYCVVAESRKRTVLHLGRGLEQNGSVSCQGGLK